MRWQSWTFLLPFDKFRHEFLLYLQLTCKKMLSIIIQFHGLQWIFEWPYIGFAALRCSISLNRHPRRCFQDQGLRLFIFHRLFIVSCIELQKLYHAKHCTLHCWFVCVQLQSVMNSVLVASALIFYYTRVFLFNYRFGNFVISLVADDFSYVKLNSKIIMKGELQYLKLNYDAFDPKV